MNAEQKRQLILFGVAAGFLTTVAGVAYFGERSKTPDASSNQIPQSVPGDAYDYAPALPSATVSPAEEKAQKITILEEQGYHCVTIERGDWLTKILREEGAPGIDSGPYVVVRNNGSKQKFNRYNELPNDVFPNEEFCFKNENGQGNNGANFGKHGIVFQQAIRQQNRQFSQAGRNIQAIIRTKQRIRV